MRSEESENEDSVVPSQVDSNRFKEVLDQEKDLSKNFEKDLISALQRLSQEIDEKEDDPSRINFTLAGMVINGSANVYGKKVDYVYDLTNLLLNNLVLQSHNEDEHGGQQRRQKKHYEFVEVINLEEDLQRRDFNTDSSDSESFEPRLTSLPLALLPLRDCEKNDSLLVSEDGEEIGQRLDLCVNRFCSNRVDVVLYHKYSRDIPSCLNGYSPVTNDHPHDSDSDDDDDDENPHAMDFQLDIPNDMKSAGDTPVIPDCNVIDADSIAISQAAQHNEPNENTPHLTGVKDKNVNVAEPKTKSKCKELKLMDPYQVVVKQERKASLRPKILPRIWDDIGSSPVTRRRRYNRRSSSSSDNSTADNKIKVEPYWEFLDKLGHTKVLKKGFKNMPYFESLKELAYEETLKRRRLDRKGKKTLQTECQASCQIPGVMSAESDDDISNHSDPGLNEEDADMLENGPSPLPPFQLINDIPYSPHLQSHIAMNLHELQKAAFNSQKSTQLSERVEAWNRHVNPILEQERKRRDFDPNQYQKAIMDSFGEKKSILFRDVVRPKEEFEVGRYLVCSLFLASNMNISFGTMNGGVVSNDARIVLLSKELREGITECLA